MVHEFLGYDWRAVADLQEEVAATALLGTPGFLQGQCARNAARSSSRGYSWLEDTLSTVYLIVIEACTPGFTDPNNFSVHDGTP